MNPATGAELERYPVMTREQIDAALMPLPPRSGLGRGGFHGARRDSA